MSWTLQRPSQQMVKTYTLRYLLTAVCILTLAAILASAALTQRASAAQASSPTVVGNFLVDQDHSLPFPQNKQNEPAITR